MPYILIKMKPIASEGNNQGHHISGIWPMFVQYLRLFRIWLLGLGLWAFGLDVDYLGFVLFI